MACVLSLFNHKGGVSKTTTTFNLGWMLASKGFRVILVDADPQCNLTGVILGWHGADEFDKFYEANNPNIRDGLAPAFESQPKAIAAVECFPVDGREGLLLLPGHIRLSEYEVTLGIAQELSGSIQTLQNLPGSISHLIAATADKYGAHFVLIDMNPSLSSINQNVLMTSDFFLVPTSPDYFSLMAIDSLSNVLPRWHAWSLRAQQSKTLQTAAYPFPKKTPKFLGTVIQKYRPRSGAPTVGFQQWIDDIGERVQERMGPALAPLGMLLEKEQYDAAGVDETLTLALVADFNTLIATSQTHRKPVFALPDDALGQGVIYEQNSAKREEFRLCFSELADTIITLTGVKGAAA
jgi:cellulose biosynthesis protein BcsQ